MKKIHAGQTQNWFPVKVIDPGTGRGVTGLRVSGSSWSNAITCAYWREGAASAVPVSLADVTSNTWAAGNLWEVDSTNLPGIYALALPDAAVATGARRVVVTVRVTQQPANKALPDLDFEIEIDQLPYQDPLFGRTVVGVGS